MAFLGIGKSKYQNQYEGLKDEFGNDKSDIKGILDRISQRSNSAYEDSEMSVDDRFGDSLNRVRDSVADDRAGAQRSITRGLMAGGGDVTGKGASALNQVTESGNQSISNAIRGYTDAARQERRNDLSRGDSLATQELQGNQNMLNMTLGQMMNAQSMEMQRKQSNKQLLGDVIGAAGSVAGDILGG